MNERNQSIYQYLKIYGEQNKTQMLLISETENLSAGMVLQMVDDLASMFRHNGVREYTKVALQMTRDIGAIVIFLALESLGATVILTDAHYDIETYLEQFAGGLQIDFLVSKDRMMGAVNFIEIGK